MEAKKSCQKDVKRLPKATIIQIIITFLSGNGKIHCMLHCKFVSEYVQLHMYSGTTVYLAEEFNELFVLQVVYPLVYPWQ